MSRFLLIAFAMTITQALFGQSVGVGTNSPHPNAALDIKQNANKGLLIPRGSAATRQALDTNTAKGLLLYDTTTNSIWAHNGNGNAQGWSNLQPVQSSTIIPYTSRLPVNLYTDPTGGSEVKALIGFGDWADYETNGSDNIEPVNYPFHPNYMFPMSRDGVISSLSGHFVTTDPLNLIGTTLKVTAQVYISVGSGNIFMPLPAKVELPDFFGILPAGQVRFAIATDLNIPLPALSRILVAFHATTEGVQLQNVVWGIASAGVSIQ